MEQSKEYYVFISYQSEDVEWAIWLQHELEHYHLPASFNGRTDIRQELRPVFRDIDELAAGNLPEQIKRALENSQNLIVVCSPQAAASPWVNQEVETFISLGRTDRIFPFIVEGSSPKEFFPPSLLELPRNEERLGGDASKQGRDIAFVKVVAGMLRLGFDSLWNRYEKEKTEEERIQREQRNKLFCVQSRLVAEKANRLTEDGNSYLARLLLLEVLPKDLKRPDRPYVIEAEASLRYTSHFSSAILRGHTGGVRTVFFSSDGKRIVSTSADGTIRIWDADTGQELQKIFDCKDRFDGHQHLPGVTSAVFSPKGKHIVSISDFRIISIWDVETGKEVSVEDHHDDILSSASGINDDNTTFTSEESVLNALFWIKRYLKEIRYDLYRRIRSISFSPDLKRFYIVPFDGKKIVVLDFEIKEKGYLEFEHERFQADPAGFSPDGKYFASISWNECVVWYVKTHQKITSLPRGGDFVTFSPDGKFLVTAGRRDNVRIWNALTGQEMMRLEGDRKSANSAVFSPDSKRIVTIDNNTIHIWDVLSGRKIKTLEGHRDKVNSVIFSPDGKRIISASNDNTIRIWDADTKTGEKLMKLEGHTYYGGHFAIFSPDGTRIALLSKDDTIRIWDSKTEEIIQKLEGHTDYVFSASFSPDGKLIVSSSSDGTIRIWNVESGEELMKLEEGFEDIVNFAAFSPDSSYVIAILRDRTILIMDVKTGQKLRRLRKQIHIMVSKATGKKFFDEFEPEEIDEPFDRDEWGWNKLYTASISSDGKYIASVSGNNKTIIIWDVETGQEFVELEGHTAWVTSIAFSSDGWLAVSASEDNTVRVWNAKTGQGLRKLEGHTDIVFNVAFSPDNNYIISASLDKSVIIWDTETGVKLMKISDFESGIRSAFFSPDGKRIISVSCDNVVRIKDFPPLQELIDSTRERFKGRLLTHDERRKCYLE